MAPPTDLPPIVPHLCVQGGEDAVAFYERAFGAEPVMVMPTEDGGRLMHAALAIYGGQVYLHDEFPEHPSDIAAPPTRGGASASINVNLPDPDAVDAAFARAVEAGAAGTMAPADMFWGARYARVRDPFGHVWAFNAPLPVAT